MTDERRSLRELYETMTTPDLYLLRSAFQIDASELRRTSTRDFCSNRIALINEVLAGRPHDFQPDHNGECTVCDEPADDPRHERPRARDRAAGPSRA
jgi:hypothetical protein